MLSLLHYGQLPGQQANDWVDFRVPIPMTAAADMGEERLSRLKTLLPFDGEWTEEWLDSDSDYSIAVGRASRDFVTILMAIAQGHPIDPIMDAVEARRLRERVNS